MKVKEGTITSSPSPIPYTSSKICRAEVPEFTAEVKSKLRKIIKEYRASVKNPIDLGASGSYDPNTLFKPVKILFNENAVDAVIMANLGEQEKVIET